MYHPALLLYLHPSDGGRIGMETHPPFPSPRMNGDLPNASMAEPVVFDTR
jgi:hypothetical protein